MSGGYKNGRPETPGLFTELRRLREQVDLLQRRQATVVVGVTSNSVIIKDSNGVSWKLGVTTSGATTWTQV